MGQLTVNENKVAVQLRRGVENAERDSKLIQAMIDASSSGIVILDEDRTVVFANRSWRQFATRTGSLSGTHGVGRKYPDLLLGMASTSHEGTSALKNGLDRVIEREEIEFQMKYRCNAVTDPLWISMHAAAFAHPTSSSVRLILVTHDDVSAAECVSNELRKDELLLRRLLKTTNILPWERNSENTRFTYVGEQASDLLGFSSDEWKREGFWAARIHPADRERVIAEYSGFSRSRDHFKTQYRMITKEGRVVWIEDLVDIVRAWSKSPMMHGFMTDVTERKQAEFILADLSGRLINAQEEERKRIARELHDDFNQRIALIAIELEQVAQGPVDAALISTRLNGLKRRVSEISNDIHRMSYELHPSKLDHLGLASALNSFCNDVTRSRGIKVHLQRGTIPAVLPRDITLCIFRVAQEALQNAAKHSGADLITVTLNSSEDRLEVNISDKGKGFDPSREQIAKGLGLTSMQERVRHVGGEFWISSSRSRGTVVHASVPINRERS
jgi:PAS domain S-box-containing protein